MSERERERERETERDRYRETEIFPPYSITYKFSARAHTYLPAQKRE